MNWKRLLSQNSAFGVAIFESCMPCVFVNPLMWVSTLTTVLNGEGGNPSPSKLDSSSFPPQLYYNSLASSVWYEKHLRMNDSHLEICILCKFFLFYRPLWIGKILPFDFIYLAWCSLEFSKYILFISNCLFWCRQWTLSSGATQRLELYWVINVSNRRYLKQAFQREINVQVRLPYSERITTCAPP